MDNLLECAICEKEPGVVFCSCEEQFCENCFNKKHLKRKPNHRRGGTHKTETFWDKVTGTISEIAGAVSNSNQFKKDEAAKWFGLHARTEGKHRISTLVETPRFRNLMEDSLHFHKNSPRTQFPSITSFVGFTGAGKSLLIRTLMYHAKEARDFESLEAPVPGAQSGGSAMISTTGEVNLYLEPSSFGTATPMFFVDCEGMLGTEPLAAQHQSDWTKYGRKYEIQVPMDRRTAVQTLYPRFLYIFSDVICYVTRDHKSWADSADRLMEWSKVGAQNTINQYSLPALIIILNAPTLENEAWVSDDHEAATRDFFHAVDEEIRENDKLRGLAAKYGDKTMRQLFSRSYSSVYVHYVPLKGWGSLGTSAEIYKQTERLSQRIKSDTERVQKQRAESWTRFDTKQMSLVVDYAFDHLRKGTREPFDFGQCRQKMTIPHSTELHFAEYLGLCLDGPIEKKFDATAAALGSAILKNAVSAKGKDLILLPSVVFNKDIQAICKRAMSHFLDKSAQCSYVDPDSGERCVNTKAGHAKGHQRSSGVLLKEGLFVDGDFDTPRFLRAIDDTVVSLMKTVNAEAHSNRRKWQLLVAMHHRKNIKDLRMLGGYPSPESTERENDENEIGSLSFWRVILGLRKKNDNFLSTSVCYGCLFGKPEYRLPCRHTICETCLKDNDQTVLDIQHEGTYVHKDCIVCGDFKQPGWPYRVRIRPDLSGVRVLSLDGGGVRGIVELVVLERLEELIGIGLPIGTFFDLIMGTSAGGLVAMGLGIQKLTAKDCTSKFRSICRNGFNNKFLTKTWGLGWLARWIRSSIYLTADMEKALLEAFGTSSPTQVFGMKNHCRVAVTTTVDKDCNLIANYNRGGDDRYLNSELHLWEAARCTSAAPMFFEPMRHSGVDCRDGGLKENNPLQIAVNESKKLWGEKAHFDLILSVGSGQADIPQSRPTSKFIIPSWLSDLLTTLLSNMNGEDAWLRYKDAQPQRVLERSSRLNVRFPGTKEPALDALEQIDSMESTARAYNKFHERVSNTPFSPISGITKTGMLETLADRLRASLYYLQVKSVTQLDEVYIIRGWIRCQIDPSDSGFHRLLKQTSGFKVKKMFYSAAGVPRLSGSLPMNLEVEFTHQSPDEPIRIDVDFGKSHMVTISGFPMKIKALLEYWESSSFKVEPTFFAAELDSTPHIPAANNETSQRENHKHTEAPTRETPRLPTESREVQHAVQNDKHEVKLPTRQEEAQSSTGERPRSKQEQFVDAAKDGKLDEVKKLLQSGASVQKKYGGWTALGRAAQEGHEAVVKFLVENGADLNVRMDVGWGILPGDGSALTWAAGGGHLEVVRYLVARGANLDIQAQKPIFFGTGGTAVTMASGKGKLDVVEYLLESGADKENKDGIPGWDAFICACDQGQLKVVEFFVETRKVDTHRIDGKGQTPIFAATLEGRHDVMEYLVGKGASLNTQDFNGDSLLHHVATKGKKRTAVWLRRRGANLKAMNKSGKTPLDLAIKRSQETEGNTYGPLIESLDWKKPEPDCDDGDGGCSLM